MAVLHLLPMRSRPTADLPPRTSPRPIRTHYFDEYGHRIALGSAISLGSALVAAFRNLVWQRAWRAEIYAESGARAWALHGTLGGFGKPASIVAEYSPAEGRPH